MSWDAGSYKINPKIQCDPQALFQKVVEALASIHESGYSHGDIRPENLIFNATTNQLVVIDFSNSKKLDVL